MYGMMSGQHPWTATAPAMYGGGGMPAGEAMYEQQQHMLHPTLDASTSLGTFGAVKVNLKFIVGYMAHLFSFPLLQFITKKIILNLNSHLHKKFK